MDFLKLHIHFYWDTKIFSVHIAPDTVKLTTEGDLSYFDAQLDDVSVNEILQLVVDIVLLNGLLLTAYFVQ